MMFNLTRQGERAGYAPLGRLSWRGNYGGGIEVTLEQEIASAGSDWPLLRGGLFGRDAKRVAESVAGWHAFIVQARQHPF